MTSPGEPAPQGWRTAWPDAVAFLLGLGVAWFAGWNTADLVWSLWLSSLVVGYAVLVWSITRPLREVALGLAGDVAGIPVRSGALGLALVAGGSLFMIAFFTVHFGGFHFVHSIFLNLFFPVFGGEGMKEPTPDAALYAEVFRRYWWFLPAAFLAERTAFQAPVDAPGDTSVTTEAIRRRKARKASDPMTAPYRNVIRMHLLIFFFAFTSMAGVDNFVVYGVVYAVYFFPWRLVVRKRGAAA
jgi:hypothetical protein